MTSGVCLQHLASSHLTSMKKGRKEKQSGLYVWRRLSSVLLWTRWFIVAFLWSKNKQKTRQEDGTKHSLFLSFFSRLAVRGFHLLCVVCTPLDDNMTASLLLLHQHVNGQQRCRLSFVCLWGPNDTLTAVCMCFLLARLILISVTFSLFPVNTWVDKPFYFF